MSQTDDDEDESGFWDMGYWDASWEVMDLVQEHKHFVAHKGR